MSARIRTILIFTAILLPSLHFVWKNRDMPQFAYLHDDGLLFVGAKSIAQDGGYRISSLPENPLQTKFPPLYPLYLSAAWKIDPHFPENLRIATFLGWLMLAGYLALAWIWYRRNGVPEWRIWLLVALLGLNPYVIWFGSILFSDLFFSCWLIAALIVASRNDTGNDTGNDAGNDAGNDLRGGVRAAFLAGVLGGAAYLARSSGIALLIALPAWYLWRRQPRRAAAFAAGMLPFVAGWSLWTRSHISHTTDLATMFYTDYVRYMMHVTWNDMPVLLWKNIDQLLYAMGSMALPRIYGLLPLKILTQVIAVAMIAGTVRLARRKFGIEYGLYALVSCGILLVCNFPSTERYMIPLYPLLLAGLLAELEHMGHMFKAGFRHKDASQRVAARALSAVAALIFLGALGLQVFMSLFFLQETVDQKSAKLRDQRAAYAWIRANLPASATILSYDDPLLYLYTGRRGLHRPLDPLWWYREDHASILEAYRELPDYCRSRGLQYIYFTNDDLGRETGSDDREEVQFLIKNNPELTPVFTAGIGTVYKIAPAPGAATAANRALP